MLSNRRKNIIAILVCILSVMLLVVGCGEETVYSSDTSYVEFYDNTGKTRKVGMLGRGTFTYDYSEHLIYKIKWRGFFDDGTPTERNTIKYEFPGNKPGTYTIAAHFQLYNPKTGEPCGVGSYFLDVVIREKQDNRVMPEVSFDLNGGTIEGEGDDIRYVYQYDGKEHYPLIRLSYENKEIEISPDAQKLAGRILQGEETTTYDYRAPKDIGVYLVRYEVFGDGYVRTEDRLAYKPVDILITMEIREGGGKDVE